MPYLRKLVPEAGGTQLLEAVRVERDRLLALLDGISDEVWACDAEGHVSLLNVRAASSTGVDGEGTGPTVGELAARLDTRHSDGTRIAPEEAPLLRALNGESLQGEELIRDPRSGEDRWRRYSAGPVRDPAGAIVGAVGVFRDVTAERRLEAERRELADAAMRRAAELEATLQSMPDGFILYDTEGAIVTVNAAANRMLGYSPDVERQSIRDRLRTAHLEWPDGRALEIDELPYRRALGGERVERELYRLVRAGHPLLWVQVTASPLADPEGRPLGAVAVVADVTRLHDLRAQQRDVAHAVTHDLRTPLSAILANAQYAGRLAERLEGGARIQRAADKVTANVQRMTSMIDELAEGMQVGLDARTTRPEPVDLESALKNFLEQSRGGLETDRVRLELRARPVWVRADPRHLDRILTNLVTNALKYGPRDEPVRVVVRARGDRVAVSVVNGGPGIDESEQDRLFDRFYRGRQEGRTQGLGLGLFIARSLVEAQDGRIRVTSRPGRTAFTFTLPKAQGVVPTRSGANLRP